jgi:hypothetical protein
MPGLVHRVREQWRLLCSSGLTATNYYSYRLYRPELSSVQKAVFLGFFEGWRWQVAVNRPDATYLVFDKLIFSRYLRDCGIPQPECLGVFGLFQGPAEDVPAEIIAAEFKHFLSEGQREDFFLKPICGRGGSGNFSIGRCLEAGERWEQLPSRKPITKAELVALIAEGGVPYMAQERMVPHADLSCFGEDVLHTARCITVLDSGVEVAQAALRIGLGKLPVDNTTKGNAVAGIDVASVLGTALALRDPKRPGVPRSVDTHPLTGQQIGGQQMPLWKETLEMLRRAATCFHPLQVLAWDVAITQKGPVVIEANTNPSLIVTQMANDEGLLATALGDYLHRRGLLEELGVGVALTAIFAREKRSARILSGRGIGSE